MNTTTIQVDNLTKQYKNVLAVKNISFKINRGKIIGLLGPNGCGKSTTIGMILGLIKPSNGTVTINHKNIENFHCFHGYYFSKRKNSLKLFFLLVNYSITSFHHQLT